MAIRLPERALCFLQRWQYTILAVTAFTILVVVFLLMGGTLAGSAVMGVVITALLLISRYLERM